MPFTIISIIITILGVWNNFSIQNFLPIFGYNFKTTFLVGLSNCFSMYIITYFFYLKPYLKECIEFKKVVTYSYGICWILLVLTIIPIMTLFSADVNSAPLNSLYLLSRQIELGTFLQRTDAIFILLWIISIFCYLSFIVFLINSSLKKLVNLSNEKILSFPVCCILFGLSIIPFNTAQTEFVENTLYRYLILTIIFGVEFIILIFANIKFKQKGKRKI